MSAPEEKPDKLRLSIWINPEKDPEIFHFFQSAFDGNVSATARMLMSVGANVLLMTPGVISKEYGIEFGNMLPVSVPALTYADRNKTAPTGSKRTKKTSVKSQKIQKPKVNLSPKTVESFAAQVNPLTNNPPAKEYALKENTTPSTHSNSVNTIESDPSLTASEAQLRAAALAFDALDSSF